MYHSLIGERKRRIERARVFDESKKWGRIKTGKDISFVCMKKKNEIKANTDSSLKMMERTEWMRLKRPRIEYTNDRYYRLIWWRNVG